jgi:hypothetical protein
MLGLIGGALSTSQFDDRRLNPTSPQTISRVDIAPGAFNWFQSQKYPYDFESHGANVSDYSFNVNKSTISRYREL